MNRHRSLSDIIRWEIEPKDELADVIGRDRHRGAAWRGGPTPILLARRVALPPRACGLDAGLVPGRGISDTFAHGEDTLVDDWRSVVSRRSGWFPYEPTHDPNAGDLAHPGRSGRVVRIGAICDFATGAPETGPSQSFSVREFVELEDGRHVVVRELGWTTSSVRELVELEGGRRVVLENAAPARAGLTLDSIRQDVLNVVLPDDDAEAAVEAHPWEWLAELARQQGIAVTADELKALPYEVVLTKRLREWLETP